MSENLSYPVFPGGLKPSFSSVDSVLSYGQVDCFMEDLKLSVALWKICGKREVLSEIILL